MGREVYAQCPKCLFCETVNLDENGKPDDLSPKFRFDKEKGELYCRNCSVPVKLVRFC